MPDKIRLEFHPHEYKGLANKLTDIRRTIHLFKVNDKMKESVVHDIYVVVAALERAESAGRAASKGKGENNGISLGVGDRVIPSGGNDRIPVL
jgi:hypothetical protein